MVTSTCSILSVDRRRVEQTSNGFTTHRRPHIFTSPPIERMATTTVVQYDCDDDHKIHVIKRELDPVAKTTPYTPRPPICSYRRNKCTNPCTRHKRTPSRYHSLCEYQYVRISLPTCRKTVFTTTNCSRSRQNQAQAVRDKP